LIVDYYVDLTMSKNVNHRNLEHVVELDSMIVDQNLNSLIVNLNITTLTFERKEQKNQIVLQGRDNIDDC